MRVQILWKNFSIFSPPFFIISAVTSSFPGLLPTLSSLMASFTSSKIGGGSDVLSFQCVLWVVKFSFFLYSFEQYSLHQSLTCSRSQSITPASFFIVFMSGRNFLVRDLTPSKSSLVKFVMAFSSIFLQ